MTELQDTLNLLPLSLPETSPPADLRARVWRSAQQTGQVQRNVTELVTPELVTPELVTPESVKPSSKPIGVMGIRPRSQHHWHSWWLGLGGIAAASAIVILGFQNYRLQQDLRLVNHQNAAVLQSVQAQLEAAEEDRDRYQSMMTMLRQPNNRLLPMSGTSIRPNGYSEASSGSLVIAPHKNWAVLSLQNLPTPPPRKAYQLWAVVNGKKVYCTEFKPDVDGKVLVEIPAGEWSGTPMVVITLEEEGTIPNQTSTMVMNSPSI